MKEDKLLGLCEHTTNNRMQSHSLSKNKYKNKNKNINHINDISIKVICELQKNNNKKKNKTVSCWFLNPI